MRVGERGCNKPMQIWGANISDCIGRTRHQHENSNALTVAKIAHQTLFAYLTQTLYFERLT
ncbi:MAG: hypothetical protein DWI22_01140 [Planctomycetota bacterium]|nr:MAG: hypothetical protein DWI22_01140 [Planctomycetota bacterium]